MWLRTFRTSTKRTAKTCVQRTASLSAWPVLRVERRRPEEQANSTKRGIVSDEVAGERKNEKRLSFDLNRDRTVNGQTRLRSQHHPSPLLRFNGSRRSRSNCSRVTMATDNFRPFYERTQLERRLAYANNQKKLITDMISTYLRLKLINEAVTL